MEEKRNDGDMIADLLGEKGCTMTASNQINAAKAAEQGKVLNTDLIQTAAGVSVDTRITWLVSYCELVLHV